MIYLGRKNSKGKNKELTDFSYLLNKDEDKDQDEDQDKDVNNRVKKDDEKED